MEVKQRTRQNKADTADRERSAINYGGPRLKLQVNQQIPGYHLYWGNDDEGQLEYLLEQGFEFVTSGEVSLSQGIVSDAELTSRISRHAGLKADGTPMRAYLLKIPEDIWREIEDARYAQADAWDKAIHEEAIERDSHRYRPDGRGIDMTNTAYKG